jgi:hypothetical protein
VLAVLLTRDIRHMRVRMRVLSLLGLMHVRERRWWSLMDRQTLMRCLRRMWMMTRIRRGILVMRCMRCMRCMRHLLRRELYLSETQMSLASEIRLCLHLRLKRCQMVQHTDMH